MYIAASISKAWRRLLVAWYAPNTVLTGNCIVRKYTNMMLAEGKTPMEVITELEKLRAIINTTDHALTGEA